MYFPHTYSVKRLTSEHSISCVSEYTATYVEAHYYEAEDGPQNKQKKGFISGIIQNENTVLKDHNEINNGTIKTNRTYKAINYLSYS